MVRKILPFAAAAGVALFALNADAIIFGSKKLEMSCLLSNEHPGAGGQPTQLPTQILSSKGMGSTTGRIHVMSKGKVLEWNAVATAVVTKSGDRYKLAATFTKKTGQLIHRGTASLPIGYWGAVTWQNWPKGQAYLELKCLVQKAR